MNIACVGGPADRETVDLPADVLRPGLQVSVEDTTYTLGYVSGVPELWHTPPKLRPLK